MSQFDFPRIHVRGLININVGTANNDDYATKVVAPTYEGGNPDNPPDMASYSKLPLRLADTDQVQPTTFGRSDNEFQTWASQKLPVLSSEGAQSEVLPAEWNYFGDMGIKLEFANPTGQGPASCKVVVATVQTTPTQFIGSAADLGSLSTPDRGVVEPFLGATFSFKKRQDDPDTSTAMIIDCSQEGSSQSSQIFCENLMLQNGGTVLLGRKLDMMSGQYMSQAMPDKASTLWLNFQRNLNFGGPGGASGSFQTVMPFDDGVEASALLALFERYRPAGETRAIRGVVFRYNMFRVQAPYRYDLDKTMEVFAQGGLNPGIGQFVGTLAPWYDGDDDETYSMGRLLIPGPATFPMPSGGHGNADPENPTFRLAPLVARVNTDLKVLSLDAVNTFPEQYTKDPTAKQYATDAYHDDTNPDDTYNPKYNLQTLTLTLTPPAKGGITPPPVTLGTLTFDQALAGAVSYGTQAYYLRGGMIDLPLSFQGYSVDDLAEGSLSLLNSQGQAYLVENELMILPRRSTLYTEQEPGAVATQFNFNGTPVPAPLTVWRKGKPMTEAEYQELVAAGKGLVVQEFLLNPIELQGSANKDPLANYDVTTLNFQLSTPVDRASTKIFAVTQKGVPRNMGGVIQLQEQINTMVNPILYVRILPNQDFSQYYKDPSAAEPVGNATLTFGVIYEYIFRNYFLLYPAMSQVVPLNNPQDWLTADMARRLLTRVSPQQWPHYEYMPRTRDLSRSRRVLLEAWARKIIAIGEAEADKANPNPSPIGRRLYVPR